MFLLVKVYSVLIGGDIHRWYVGYVVKVMHKNRVPDGCHFESVENKKILALRGHYEQISTVRLGDEKIAAQ